MSIAILAIAADLMQRKAVVSALASIGFLGHEISLLTRDGNHLTVQGPLTTSLRYANSLLLPLVALGVPTYAALRYEEAIGSGKFIMAVHTSNPYEIETIIDTLQDHGCLAVVTTKNTTSAAA